MKSIDDFLATVKITQAWQIIIIPIVFMAVDYLTGFMKAYIQHNINSTKMREGIIKKAGECIIIGLCLFCEYMISIPHDFTVFVTVYMIVLEVISILENLDALGVKLPSWITKHLKDYVNSINQESSNDE